MKNIDFGYGILCDDLDKQANEQGYALEDADLYETARGCINFLKYRKIASNKQADMMFKKLHKKVVRSLKPLEEIAMSKKPKFRLEDYQENYVMHCDTEEKAKIFCDFLHNLGRKWIGGSLYKDETSWEVCKKDTVYYFNHGVYCDKEYAEKEGYIILEFDDFNWE